MVPEMTPRTVPAKSSSMANCWFCLEPDPVDPARLMNKNLSTFIESKASFKCFDYTLIPLMSYVTSEVMVSPQLLRFFLSSSDGIAEEWKYNQLKTFLGHHLLMHPACRPGMSEYYLSVLNQHLGSFIFEKDHISDTFFDFVKRAKVAINEFAQQASREKQRSSVPMTYTKKEAIDFLKKSCKFLNAPNEEAASFQLDKTMFLFKYCVDILTHDYETSRQNYRIPLVAKIVWGADAHPDASKSLNSHCHDIIGMYIKAPALYQQDVAGYLAILAEIMQTPFPKSDYFWPLESNKLVDAVVEKLTENEDISEKILNTYVASIPSPFFRCQILQSLIYQNILDGADYPKKTPLSKKNSRPKKFFSLFDKKLR